MQKLDIINYALTKLGHRSLPSLEGQEKEAILANHLYPIVYDEILAMYSWAIAAKEITLTGVKKEDSWQCTIPDDCLRIISTTPMNAVKQLGNLLISDASTLILHYISRDIPTPHWPSQLTELMATRLAMQMAESLTQSGAKYGMAMRAFERAQARIHSRLLVSVEPRIVTTSSWCDK